MVIPRFGICTSYGREVHISLLTPREKLLDEEISVGQRPPSSATTYPSFDSRDGSIKYVLFPLHVLFSCLPLYLHFAYLPFPISPPSFSHLFILFYFYINVYCLVQLRSYVRHYQRGGGSKTAGVRKHKARGVRKREANAGTLKRG